MTTIIRLYGGKYGTLYEAFRNAVETLEWKVTYESSLEGVIRCRTFTTLLSWGEDVHILIEPNGNTLVATISSDCIGQLIDWGVNAANIRALFDAVGDEMGVPA